MPFDIASTRRSRASQVDQLEQLGALGRAAVGAGQPLMQREHLVRARPAGKAEQLGEVAERAARLGEPAGAPDTSAGPALGRTSPQAIFTSVDLPAPFGPEQPDQLARRDLEVDARSASVAAVALVQRRDGQSGRHQLDPARRQPALAQLERERTSSAVGPLLFGPGVSITTRQPLEARLGQERRAAVARRARRRRRSAWRSRLEPSGVCESLRCSEPSRSRPTTASKRSSAPPAPRRVRMS